MSSKKILLACTVLVVAQQTSGSETNGNNTPKIIITPVTSEESLEIISPNSSDHLAPDTLSPRSAYSKKREQMFRNWLEEMMEIEDKICELTKTLLAGLEFAQLSCQKLEDKSAFARARIAQARACLRKNKRIQKKWGKNRQMGRKGKQQRIKEDIACLDGLIEAAETCKNVLNWFEKKKKPFKLLFTAIVEVPTRSEEDENSNDKIMSFLEARGTREKHMKQQVKKKNGQIDVLRKKIAALKRRLARLEEQLETMYSRDGFKSD